MKSEDIQNIVFKELKACVKFDNGHGITFSNILNFLVKPYKQKFLNEFTRMPDELWIVLAADNLGYQIYYSEVHNEFGLATIEEGTNRNINLGIYGTFYEALSGM